MLLKVQISTDKKKAKKRSASKIDSQYSLFFKSNDH